MHDERERTNEPTNDRVLEVDNGIARVAFYAASASRGEPAIFREGFPRSRKTGAEVGQRLIDRQQEEKWAHAATEDRVSPS